MVEILPYRVVTQGREEQDNIRYYVEIKYPGGKIKERKFESAEETENFVNKLVTEYQMSDRRFALHETRKICLKYEYRKEK